jgi:hypothetical protein
MNSAWSMRPSSFSNVSGWLSNANGRRKPNSTGVSLRYWSADPGKVQPDPRG